MQEFIRSARSGITLDQPASGSRTTTGGQCLQGAEVLAPRRVFVLDDEIDGTEDFVEVRPGEGHGLRRTPVQRAIGFDEEEAGFRKQRRFFNADRGLATRGRQRQTPIDVPRSAVS